MSICERRRLAKTTAIVLGAAALGTLVVVWDGGCSAAGQQSQTAPEGYGLGRPATEAEIAAVNIDVSPTGEGLPPGQGTAVEGAKVYAQKCAACHGPTGTEGPMAPLVGGHGTLASDQPLKTAGSYWPYATTLYDYIRRTMPYSAPQSLTNHEVYALVAWLLVRNEIIAPETVMNARTLPAVRMPNRDGFVPDPRPDLQR
jgi:mono/diheme cytochrome c family protein